MRERFTATVAGGRYLHQACIQTILQVAFQHAVFDQHIALRGIAFVINVERATAALNRAIVHHGYAARSNPFANTPAERRGALAVEIAFKSVADGLMQQDAGPA